MFLAVDKAAFDAAAVAGGCTIGVDLATQQKETGLQVQPLSMIGVRYLVWTLGLDIPTSDAMVLQCNILARIAGVGQAWPQT